MKYSVLWQIPNELDEINILILGGGHDDTSLPPNDQLSLVALSRLSEGLRLYHIHNGSTCLIGSGNSLSSHTSQAEILMRSAVLLGISSTDTLWNPIPYNTETEAFSYVERFGTKTPLVLVTSALHMPRAIFWFKQAGISAIPAPTNYYFKPNSHRSPYNFKPSVKKIEMTGKLYHEWVGMLYGKLKQKVSFM